MVEPSRRGSDKRACTCSNTDRAEQNKPEAPTHSSCCSALHPPQHTFPTLGRDFVCRSDADRVRIETSHYSHSIHRCAPPPVSAAYLLGVHKSVALDHSLFIVPAALPTRPSITAMERWSLSNSSAPVGQQWVVQLNNACLLRTDLRGALLLRVSPVVIERLLQRGEGLARPQTVSEVAFTVSSADRESALQLAARLGTDCECPLAQQTPSACCQPAHSHCRVSHRLLHSSAGCLGHVSTREIRFACRIVQPSGLFSPSSSALLPAPCDASASKTAL